MHAEQVARHGQGTAQAYRPSQPKPTPTAGGRAQNSLKDGASINGWAGVDFAERLTAGEWQELGRRQVDRDAASKSHVATWGKSQRQRCSRSHMYVCGAEYHTMYDTGR